MRYFEVTRAEITRLGTIVLKPPSGQSMRVAADLACDPLARGALLFDARHLRVLVPADAVRPHGV